MLSTFVSYRRDRLLAFLDPWADSGGIGYQTVQSTVGIGSGGLLGTGLGESKAKWGFLPEANTDFIYSIVAEELGLLGAFAVLALFAGLAVVGMVIARNARDRFGMLLANYGALDGKQIIPAEYVKAAITPQADYLKVGHATKFNGYGYQTWINHPTEPRFAALGLHGQAIFIDAASKLVVVHTAVWPDGNDRAERGAQFRLFAAIHQKVASP